MYQQPPIRVIFRPYDHDAVQTMLRQVVNDFGRPGDHWRYRSPDPLEAADEPNAWQLDFYFANPHDAMIFGLKYQR
jgi:hypothetical protein